jgi:hypothetical protein
VKLGAYASVKLALFGLLLSLGVSFATVAKADPVWGRGSTSGVPTTRAVNTSAPLGGGGALSGDLTLTCATCATGAASSADNGIPRFDGTTGKGLQSSGLTLSDADLLSIPNTAGSGLDLYNTADQVTNFERARLSWSGNVLTLANGSGGSGATRGMQFTAGGGAFEVLSTGTFKAGAAATTDTLPAFEVANLTSWSSTSAVQRGLSVTGTVNQASGTGGFDALHANPTLTACGSTGCNLLQLQSGSTNRLRVDGSGNIVQSSAATAGHRLYNTADEATNTEYLSLAWAANVATIRTVASGSGSTRHLVLGAGTISTLNLGGSGSGASVLTGSTGTGNLALLTIQNSVNWGSTTGTQSGLAILGTVNQSISGTWNGILVNPTMVTTGSGGASLLRLQADSADKFRVDVNGKMVMDATMTAAATTGARTINKPSGSVNFAAAATSLVVTNSLVSADSIVTPVMMTADATCRIASVVPGSGSFTINMTAGCGAETRVGWVVHN